MSNQSLVRHDPERVGKALVDLFLVFKREQIGKPNKNSINNQADGVNRR